MKKMDAKILVGHWEEKSQARLRKIENLTLKPGTLTSLENEKSTLPKHPH